MLRKALAVCFVTLFSVSGFAQVEVDLEEIDPALLDPQQVDLSDVEFFFNGPVELFVTGVEHEGMTYSAVLNYDGAQTVTVEVPDERPTDMLPAAVDVSNASISVTEDGVRLNDVVADGNRYSATLAPSDIPDLVVEGVQLEESGVAVTQEDIEEGLQTIAEQEETIAEQEETIATLEEEAGDPDARTERLENTIEEQESEIAELEDTIERGESMIADLEETIENRDSRIAELETQLGEMESAAWQTASDDLTSVLLEGFEDGSAALGSWEMNGSNLEQTDPDQLFAKYELPVDQDADELLYTLEGYSNGSGRQGYGLHFLSSGVEEADLWGYGTSYLVWVTSNPDTYKTDSTFVQLYASSSDTDMVNVASEAVSADISDSNELQVYTDRESGEITVSMAGEKVFSFTDSDFIDSGMNVALRTLDTAVFEMLEVAE